MNKSEFLHILRQRLSPLPAEEREQHIAYYEELFSDMLEEGMSEEEVSAHLGDPEQIAREILAEQPLPKLVKSRVRPSGGWTALSITLIVLGSPVWLPLLIAAASLVLSVFVVVWALILSVLAVALAVGISAVAIVLAAIFGYLKISSLLMLGLVLTCAGLCLLTGLLAVALGRAAVKGGKWLWRQIKKLFIKKEG